ncbi:MAG TPA: c-type cytochrome [Isosphaeraceae bacterium]|nr:c-type cytochrome [Isosphaeraceae bacterium]
MRDHLLERVARLLTARALDSDFQACARLLDAALGPPQMAKIVSGMEKGLEGRQLPAVPAPLAGSLERLWSVPEPEQAVVRLAVRLGSPEALEKALDEARDKKRPEADRVSLIELAGQVDSEQSRRALLELLGRPESRDVELAVLNALGRFGQPEVAEAVLKRYSTLRPELRDRALDLLCSRRAWAAHLLEAMSQGRIPPKDLKSAQVLQMVKLDDSQLTAAVERIWGRVPGPGSPEKIRRIAEVRGMLPEGDKGNVARGKIVFQQACAGCHRLFDEGAAIGPDLTGAERGNLEFLLISLVDPSALVRKEFQAQTVATSDGRVLTGLLVEEAPQSITLFDSKQQKTVVPRNLIEEQKASSTSLMPEGLLDPLSDEQVRDLFKYLQSSATVAR